MQRIVIFSQGHGWHERQLRHALAQRGLESITLSLADCRLGADDNSSGIAIPGLDGGPPNAVLVRGVPAGSFEQVTFSLTILHALQQSGVCVYNSACHIERTVDKAMTSFLLLKHGLKTPRFWVCQSSRQARAIIDTQLQSGMRLVQKPLFGNCGRGLKLIDSTDCQLDAQLINGVYYLQQYIEQAQGEGIDWRIFVIAHRAIAAMQRVSPGWITNRARGGECRQATLTPALRTLAEQASKATGIRYGGIDIIRNRQGDYLALEVNSIPAWRGLQAVHDANIAGLLADDLLHNIHTRQTVMA